MRRRGQFVTLQTRGLIALPRDVRARHGLDRPGAQVEVVERDDGIIELHPHVPVPADQAWYWSERWQRMEREVDEHVDRGEIRTHDDAEEFLSFVDGVETDE